MIFYRMCCMQLTNIPIISMIKDMAKWIVLRDEFFLFVFLNHIKNLHAHSLEHTRHLPSQQKFSIFNLHGFSLCMNSIRLQVLRQPLKELIHSVG